MDRQSSLRWFDYLLLAGFCLALYGFTSLYERTLNAHETVHCLNVREMLASGDWLVPTYGGRPWLERPPLPHWITAALAAPFGAGERVWAYRLSSHVVGTVCVLLTAWMASIVYGRRMGLLAGLVLATMFDFYVYSTVTECDISLCLIVTTAMALFVHAEFGAAHGEKGGLRFVGSRRWAVAAFFLVAGLTNIAKGLFFGTLFIGVALGGFLLGNFIGRREAPLPDAAPTSAASALDALRRYVWLWGWLLFLVTAGIWAFLIYHRYPDIVDLWHNDYMGRVKPGYMQEPLWYYFMNLPVVTAPWFLTALVGLGLTARQAGRPLSFERFLWCWAWLPVLFFSIPKGKHHHYLLHGLAPWAILGALGARQVWLWLTQAPQWLRQPLAPTLIFGLGGSLALYLLRGKIPGAETLLPWLLVAWPALVALWWWGAFHPRPGIALCCVLATLAAAHSFLWAYRGDHLSRYQDDLAFIDRTRQTVPGDRRIYVKADYHPLNGSWLLFYLGERTAFLHNLSFLRDSAISDSTLYLVGRLSDEDELRKYGYVEIVDSSRYTRGQTSERERYALFRFTYRTDLARLPASRVRITPCQATGRAMGPVLE